MIEHSLLLKDTMRGLLWEEKYRGTLGELNASRYIEIESRAEKLLSTTEISYTHCNSAWQLQSRLGLGTYHWNYSPGVIYRAIELGIGMIDTAEGYGFGAVERELGNILCHGLNGVVIASKVSRNHLSYKSTMSAAQRSREKLRVSSIGLYQIHWPVLDSLPYTLDAMAKLIELGVIQRIGVCNFCVYQLDRAMKLASSRGLTISSNQIRLNKIDRSATECLLEYCCNRGIEIIAYSPMAQGKITRNINEALNWVLSHSILCTIPATNNVNHLNSNWEATKDVR